MTTFTSKLLSAQQTNNSWTCIGLDPVMERMPDGVRDAESPFLRFAQAIVEATSDVASAYKPNLGFWLAQGVTGLSALKEVIAEASPHQLALSGQLDCLPKAPGQDSYPSLNSLLFAHLEDILFHRVGKLIFLFPLITL